MKIQSIILMLPLTIIFVVSIVKNLLSASRGEVLDALIAMAGIMAFIMFICGVALLF